MGRRNISPVWYQWKAGSEQDTGHHSPWDPATPPSRRETSVATPKVSLSVATERVPYQYVILEGEATVSSDNIKEAVRTIFSRYEGAERGEEDAPN